MKKNNLCIYSVNPAHNARTYKAFLRKTRQRNRVRRNYSNGNSRLFRRFMTPLGNKRIKMKERASALCFGLSQE